MTPPVAGAEALRDSLLQKARTHLAAGQLAAADTAARTILDSDPQHAGALTVVGEIAMRLGLRDHALRALTAAAASGSGPDVAGLLDRANRLPPEAPPPLGSLLVIKAWRQGFWSEIVHVLGCALLAELTGRVPVTLWGANCLYSDGSEADAFRLYFEPLSHVTPADLAAMTGADFFPAKWSPRTLFKDEFQKYEGEGAWTPAIAFLGRRERIAVADFHVSPRDLIDWIPPFHPLHGRKALDIFRYLTAKYLHPSAAAQEAVRRLDAEIGLSNVELAVHARGSDKSTEVGQLDAVNRSYFEFLPKIYEGGKVLLLTEDDTLRPHFAAMFGDKLIEPHSIRQQGGAPPHWRTDVDRVQIGLEALRDVYAAVPARKFVGNGGSNFSCMIPFVRPPGSVNILAAGGNSLLVRSDFKFSMPVEKRSVKQAGVIEVGGQ